jgi:hypothetical protein
MNNAVRLLALAALACACGDPPPCRAPRLIQPAAGTGTASRPTGLVPGAEEEMLTINADRTRAEYRFKREGLVYTVSYALAAAPPPPARRRFVSLRRPKTAPGCSEQVGLGPVIDALEVRRSGQLIAHGQEADFSPTGCQGGQRATRKASAEWNGPPDGSGALLGDADIIWRLSGSVGLKEGDEVNVTVLDDADQPFELIAGSSGDYLSQTLGTLRGTGSLPVPPGF